VTPLPATERGTAWLREDDVAWAWQGLDGLPPDVWIRVLLPAVGALLAMALALRARGRSRGLGVLACGLVVWLLPSVLEALALGRGGWSWRSIREEAALAGACVAITSGNHLRAVATGPRTGRALAAGGGVLLIALLGAFVGPDLADGSLNLAALTPTDGVKASRLILLGSLLAIGGLAVPELWSRPGRTARRRWLTFLAATLPVALLSLRFGVSAGDMTYATGADARAALLDAAHRTLPAAGAWVLCVVGLVAAIEARGGAAGPGPEVFD
jgi:hypothetical protein